MSGFEIAGIIVGVLPIAISVFSKIQNEEGPLFTLLKYKGRLNELIVELENQQAFWQWDIVELLQTAGIPNLPDDIQGSMEALAEVLRHTPHEKYIERYLEGAEKTLFNIMRRYGEHFTAITSRLLKILKIDPAAKHDLDTVNHAHADLRAAFSMTTAVRFAIGSRSCKKHVDGMRQQREDLGVLLDRIKRIRDAAEPVRPTQALWEMIEDSTQVQMSAASLFSAARRNWKCDRHDQHAIMIRLEDRFNRQIKPGVVTFRLYFCDKGDPLQFQQVEVTARKTKSQTRYLEPQHTEAHKAASTIGPIIPGINVTETPVHHTESTGRLLANMCLSAEKARGRGETLALDLVDGSLKVATTSTKLNTSFIRTITLAELLVPTSKTEGPPILALAQGRLAFNVASAALQLRLTSWCGTMWDKHELKFLVASNGVVNSETPYIEKTIENSQVEVSERMDRMILEIAILVLEILHRTSIEVWAKENDKEIPEGFDKRLEAATIWLYHSKEKLLPEQVQAVSACLRELVVLDCAWEPEFQHRYCENVIKPLQRVLFD